MTFRFIALTAATAIVLLIFVSIGCHSDSTSTARSQVPNDENLPSWIPPQPMLREIENELTTLKKARDAVLMLAATNPHDSLGMKSSGIAYGLSIRRLRSLFAQMEQEFGSDNAKEFLTHVVAKGYAMRPEFFADMPSESVSHPSSNDQ